MKTLNEDMDPLFQRHGDRSHRDEFLPPLGTVSSWESMKKDAQTQVNENPRASSSIYENWMVWDGVT